MRNQRTCIAVLTLLLMAGSSALAEDLVVSGRMHHVRSHEDREWAEFPPKAEATALVLPFDATVNRSESTLRLRHRDLKQSWRVLVNGKEIARLPLDESDMITYWPVPPGTLRDGRNELRIDCTGTRSDDVTIGEATLIDRAAKAVLTEATVDVSVTEEPGGRGTPSRITIANEHGTLVSVGTMSGPEHAVRPGIVYSRTGAVRLKLPGGRYVIYAGRGFEYSVASARVDLAPGSSVSMRLSIRREVDTAGWAAMDTHVHTGTFARHGDALIAERMLTIAGEGIELPVSAEHNTLVSFDDEARHAGVREHFTPILGSEVTTPSIGHFNVFPIPARRTPIDHRAPDWDRLGTGIRDVAGAPIVVLNHGRDEHGGFRPLGAARHIEIAGEDLAGWTLPANAMEVVNSGAVMTDALALPRLWMGLLNRGVILTPVGSSDSHDVARYIVGQGRTYVRCEDRDAGRIDVPQAVESVRRGRTMVSYGLLAQLEVTGKAGESLLPKDALDVRIRVQGPGWTEARRVALYVNGALVREEAIADGTKAGLKWEGTWQLPKPMHDVHLVAIATGPGVRAPFWATAKPYQPTSMEFVPYVLGISGPVFVDADGSGSFESAFEYARREVSAAGDIRELVARLGRHDGAVAVQAASLLRLRAPAAFEDTVRSMVGTAPPHVATGLTVYLNAWLDSRRASGGAYSVSSNY